MVVDEKEDKSIVTNQELENALRDVVQSKLVEAPTVFRTALSLSLKKRPEISIEIGAFYSTIIVHDRDNGRVIRQAKARFGSICPGLFEVDTNPDLPSFSTSIFHIKGRNFTVSSDSPSSFADIVQYHAGNAPVPQYIIHPDTSLCLRNITVGSRPSVPMVYSIPFAIILVYGEKVTKEAAATEVNLLITVALEEAMKQAGFDGWGARDVRR